MKMRYCLLPLVLCLSLIGFAQTTDEIRPLESGKPIEREIAGGESHTYQITLQTGQFMRAAVEQQGIDVTVELMAPDGNQIAAADVSSGAFGLEPLSHEAAVTGDYRMVVRPIAATAPRGAYQVRLELKVAATAQDKQRIAAERLLAEVARLSQQRAVSVVQTIEKAQQSLTLWRELADQYWEARTLYLIGYSYALGSKYDQAIEYYVQVLAIQREIKNRAGEGTTLGSLGFAYTSLSRYDKAIEYHEQALAIHREVKNRAGEGTTLDNLGHTYRLLTRYEKAIEYLEQALVIHREVKNRLGEGTTLNNLGTVYRTLSKHEKAVEYLEQALVIHREIKNRAGEGGALGNLGNVYNLLSRYEKAIEYYEQALAINREVKNRAAEGGQLGNLGSVYFQLSRYDKAIEYYEQALAISREVKNRASEGGTLLNLGATYSLMSRYERAIEYYEQALAISREVKNRAGEENALNNLGTAYNSLGRYEKAIEYHEQALAIHREVKNRAGEGSPLHNLGIVYRSLGRYDKAIEYYEQALAIFREAKNRAAEGAVLGTLGTAYDSLGRYEKSIEYHGQALAISREVKNRAGEGGALGNLGSSYQSLGRYENAIEYYEQALAINREVKNRAGEGDSLNNLGAVHDVQGRYDKAVESFEQALAIRREVKDQLGEGLTLHAFAQVERNRGNLAQSRALIERSLQIVEASRSEIYNPQSRASYFAAAQRSHEFYIDLLMQQHQVEPAKGLDALAVEASERARARGLLELLTEAGTNIRQGVDADLLGRERVLSRQLNAKATRQMQLLSKTHTPEQAKALRLELSQLENDYERAQAAIRKSSPHYAALTQPQPSSLAEIQQQLDTETLLLEYSLGYERSYLWAITNNSITSHELPKEEQLKQTVKQVLELLTARTRPQRGETTSQKQIRIAQAEAQLPEAARQLSQTLLGPAAAQLGRKRLVIVADGALQYIPFAMLPEPVGSAQLAVGSEKKNSNRPLATDQRPLIVGHEVVSLPSASALAIQRAELAGRKLAPKLLAVIADPVFDRSDSRFTTPAAETGDKAQTQTITGDDARSIEHLAGNSGDKSEITTLRLIPRLPFTRQEATRVLALTPKNSSFGAIDFQASRATVLNGDLSQYRYVHFATHGLLDSERPGLSALVLSMLDAQGKPQDGFLRANDIYNLKLPAELVVLSACQTGLGKEIKGEGLVGLTRGFMYAGAARVVVSLWNVNDKATADLMTKFYEKMLKQGQRPAAALRAAQVEMWRQKKWQSPYYWAAFTMQGEWR